MKNHLKNCISDLFDIVPSGFLTFFPSFTVLNELSGELISPNKNKKKIIIEPRNYQQMNKALNEYKNNAINGAALFAVCRGKMSEGIDFSDDFARCVSVIGIPFPNLSDIKVKAHKQWLEKKKFGSGSRWYIESAIRAVNQSIGRAIRHKDDYAAVILFDERYEGFKNLLCKWIRPLVKIGNDWNEIKNDLIEFFKIHANFESQSFLSSSSSSLSFSLASSSWSQSTSSEAQLSQNVLSINTQNQDNYESQSTLINSIDAIQMSQINPSSPNEVYSELPNSSTNSSSSELQLSQLTFDSNTQSSFSSSINSSEYSSSFPNNSPIKFGSSFQSNNSGNNSDSIQLSQVPINSSNSPLQSSESNKSPQSHSDSSNDKFYDAFTRTQIALIKPKISKSTRAMAIIKSNMTKQEQNELCLVLRNFKQTKDISILRNALNQMNSDECKKVILQTMNTKLKKLVMQQPN